MSIRGQEILNRLIAESGNDEDDLSMGLEEAVHDSFSQRASEINNQGALAQIDYLLEAGMDENQIAEWAGVS